MNRLLSLVGICIVLVSRIGRWTLICLGISQERVSVRLHSGVQEGVGVNKSADDHNV